MFCNFAGTDPRFFGFVELVQNCKSSILESFLNNSVLSSNNVNIDKYVLDYIEYIGANMEKIENEDLKLEIEDLFKQFVPGLEQILALENGGC